jgi:ATP-dependent helicase YprA (DUF1998 family)
MTELIALWAGNQSSDLASRISAYRAGFLPEERREIEARLSKGELLAVISTSVLELGIDIGDLDLCLLVGYPGSVVSTWQRGGRVGRSGRDSALIQVAGADGLRALQWWQEGRMLEIIEYCRQDVKITRDLYLYGRDNGYLVNLSRLNVPN